MLHKLVQFEGIYCVTQIVPFTDLCTIPGGESRYLSNSCFVSGKALDPVMPLTEACNNQEMFVWKRHDPWHCYCCKLPDCLELKALISCLNMF